MTERKQRKSPRGAFTLMELLVVTAILVMLAGIGGVIYTTYLDNTRKSRALIDVRMLTQAAEAYQVTYGNYPPSLSAMTQPTPDGGKASLEAHLLMDPWGHEYQYQAPGSHHPTTGKPDIWSQGPAGGSTAQIGNWTP